MIRRAWERFKAGCLAVCQALADALDDVDFDLDDW